MTKYHCVLPTSQQNRLWSMHTGIRAGGNLGGTHSLRKTCQTKQETRRRESASLDNRERWQKKTWRCPPVWCSSMAFSSLLTIVFRRPRAKGFRNSLYERMPLNLTINKSFTLSEQRWSPVQTPSVVFLRHQTRWSNRVFHLFLVLSIFEIFQLF